MSFDKKNKFFILIFLLTFRLSLFLSSLLSFASVYPTYCLGYFYVTTPIVAAAVVEAAKYVKFLWIDDAWVTGYIARHRNISHLVV